MSVSLRQLNRAALARQLLLEPSTVDVAAAIDAVGPLQAQHPRSPFLALRARIADFQRADLDVAVDAGLVVKTSLLRGTLHLVTAGTYPDYAAASMGARAPAWKRLARGIDLDALWVDLLDFADGADRSTAQIVEFTELWLGARGGQAAGAGVQAANWHLVRANSWLLQTAAAARWTHHGGGLYRSARAVLPSFQIPSTAAATGLTARRYLAAFGPARAADFAFWIGETSVRRAASALSTLDSELVRMTGEDGRQYLDLATAPDSDLDPPILFLPRWDGLLLGYAPDGRSRVVPEAVRAEVYRTINGTVCATFLVDGTVAGIWDVQEERGTATLRLHPLVPIGTVIRRQVTAQAERVLAFIAPEADARRVLEAPF